MSSFEKLVRHFERFPGIGSRQAKRFAHHLLNEPKETIEELSELVKNIQSEVVECTSCCRFFTANGNTKHCPLCSNPAREKTTLMVVESDSDIHAIEQARIYDGLYFVLGGLAPLIESKETQKLRGGKLKRIVAERSEEELREIILAFSVNPDGENTIRYVKELLGDSIEKNDITISTLGRGLSTGSELEYADSETIKNALKNRG